MKDNDDKPNLVTHVKSLLEERGLFKKEKEKLSQVDKNDIVSKTTDKEYVDAYVEKTKLFNKKQVWNNIKKAQNKPNSNPRNWLYAAASIAILVSGITYIYRDNVMPVQVTTIDSEVQIGTDKATLTLDNGTQIALEKGTHYENQTTKSNGEKITYNSQKGHTSKNVYNYLTVPRGGEFHLQLSDGSEVWLNSDSKIKYPVAFTKGETRKVELLYGEAYFEVSPSTNHNGATFVVHHNKQDIEVLGTAFNVKAYKDESNIYTTLVEGKIALSIEKDKIILTPNKQTIFNTNTQNIETLTVDVYNNIAWREGIFSFEGKPLKDIMVVLSRWYDVDIIFENEKLKPVLFNGVLKKDKKLSDLLNSLAEAKFIKSFSENKKTIILK